MNLELSQCCIRSWDFADAVSLQRHADNRKIWQNLRDIFPHPYTLNIAHGFLQLVTQQKPETLFALDVDGCAVGCIGLTMGADVHRRTAELGYWLGEAFWGRGIMSEAVGALTEHAFEVFDLVRIHAEPLVENAASVRVLEKAGYTREGCLRANVFKDNRILDSLVYARVSPGLRSD